MIEVTCPSGLRGRIRGMKVKEEQLFANRKLMRSGGYIAELLKGCWLETLDVGPYTFESESIDWNEVVSSDRTFLIIQVRIASHGADYEFEVHCSDCGERFGWHVNLEELDVAPVSTVGIEHIRTGRPVTVKYGDGKIAHCRLLRGSDEMFFVKNSTPSSGDLLIKHLARRITSIDGADKYRDVLKKVEDLEIAEADQLWDATDDLEGGVNTLFLIECPRCEGRQQVALPFESGFFSSRRRFVASRERSSG